MPTLDLDALLAEGTDNPFVVKIGGRDYTLLGPKDRDPREVLAYSELADQGDFVSAMKVLIRDEDIDDFLANKLPTRALEKLATDYAAHFGLLDQGEEDASPAS